MPELTEQERDRVAAFAHALVNKLLHPPTVRVKEAAGNEDGYRYAESLRELFGLDERSAAHDQLPGNGTPSPGPSVDEDQERSTS
jgi:hypothetical protein